MNRDEFYSNLEINRNSLAHSSHKYLKKEWVNGRWQYYYENKKGKRTNLRATTAVSDWIGTDEKHKVELARQNQARLQRRADLMERNFYNSKEQYEALVKEGLDTNTSVKNYVKGFMNDADKFIRSGGITQFAVDTDRYINSYAGLVKSEKLTQKAVSEYEKTPLAKISNVTSKVKSVAQSVVSKISSIKISDLFKKKEPVVNMYSNIDVKGW